MIIKPFINWLLLLFVLFFAATFEAITAPNEKYQKALAGKWYRCQKNTNDNKSEGIYLNIILETQSLIESRFMFDNLSCSGKNGKLTLTEGATLAFKSANHFQITSVQKKSKSKMTNSDVVGKPTSITMIYKLSNDLNELRLFLKSTGQNIGIYSRVIDEAIDNSASSTH